MFTALATLLAIANTCVVASGAPKPTALVPGVRIDWVAGSVELDAKVVLRKGPLELIACSPRSREHESILVTKAQPMHVFQAMGLVGLQPGSPVSYDEKAKNWRPPIGEKLQITVGCGDDDAYVPVRKWVVDPKTATSPKDIHWVFAGSKSLPDGRFLANLDGTIICLVDFESALITVGALHSADNTSLWLHANTDVIPPVGTRCTIRIRSAAPRVVAFLSATGKLTRDNHSVSVANVVAKLVTLDSPAATLVIVCEHGSPQTSIDSLRAELIAAGADPSQVSMRRLPKPAK